MAEASGSVGIGINAPARIRIKKWRVRENYHISGSEVLLLYEVVNDEGANIDGKVEKFKASKVGIIKKRLVNDGEIAEEGVALMELSQCPHNTVMKDMCADCGADLRQNENGFIEASVPMVHSIPELKVSHELAQKLGKADTRRLLEDRKLVLLVDLDQTVIHTTNDNVPNNIKGIYHFQLYGPTSPWYHTRLRPGTAEFLKHMSQLFELHICTFGARNYAHMIAQLLDPNGEFFSQRILSRDECFNATSKTDNLKALFPNGDSMVCIIDDREDVWNMASNLIQVKPYHFFQHTGDINAPPELSKHELDGEGVDFKDLKTITNDKEKEKNVNANDTDSKESLEISEETSDKTETDNDSKDKDINTSDSNDTTSSIMNEEASTTTTTTTTTITTPTTDAITETTKLSTQTETTDDIEVTNNAQKTNAITQENQTIDNNKKIVNNSVAPIIKLPEETDTQKLIQIEDPDDYLLYLEVILKSIHARFYKIYDETKEISDLKLIVPKIRSEVLRNTNLVFSGLVPNNMKLEQSRAFFIAKSLGANVSQNIKDDTTHLVAVSAGTYKVNAAKKKSDINVVNANWLWSCAERWEHVEERLFPLDRKTKNKQRQPPLHCQSPQHVVDYNHKSDIQPTTSVTQQPPNTVEEKEKFASTINPLLSFSNDDLDQMNNDYNEFFESDSSSEDEHVNIESHPAERALRKRKRQEREAERARDFFTRETSSNDGIQPNIDTDESCQTQSSNATEDESPVVKFRRGGIPSDLENGSESDESELNAEVDGELDLMGAALEREL